MLPPSSESPVESEAVNRRVCTMLLHGYYLRDPRVHRSAHALRDAGWKVKIFCLNEGDETEFEVADGVEIFRQPLSRPKVRTRTTFFAEYFSFMFRSFFALWREERREKHDLVMVHNMPNALVFSAIALRLKGCPVILDMHDAAPEVLTNLFGARSKLLKRLVYFEEKLAMKFASGLITVNRGVEDLFRKRHPKAEFLLIHNSPAAALSKTRTTTPFDEGNDVFRLVYHGHLHERYGVQKLVRALPALIESGMKLSLDVHGDGTYRDTLQKLVDELGLSDSVTLHGAFKPDEIPAFLEGKHLGVSMHVADDLGDLLLPVKILEYTDAGVPAISVRLATLRDYFADDCLYYFDNEVEMVERIKEVYANHSKAMERVERARRVSESISWERESTALVEYVEALCDTD